MDDFSLNLYKIVLELNTIKHRSAICGYPWERSSGKTQTIQTFQTNLKSKTKQQQQHQQKKNIH